MSASWIVVAVVGLASLAAEAIAAVAVFWRGDARTTQS